MDENMQKSLILGLGAAAGGWGGAVAMARIGAAYGLRLGPAGTIAGAAVGALLGAGLCRMLMPATEPEFEVEDLAGEFSVDEAA